MEHSKALKLTAMLAAAWPNWNPDRETLALYAKFLEPLPEKAGEEAVMALIGRTTREFAPPVGVVVNEIAVFALAQSGRPALTAEEAWLQVEQAIRFRGYYQDPGDFGGCVAARRAVDAIGWKNICADENVAATRAHFFRLYENYQQREVTLAIDRLNAGLPIEAPKPAERIEAQPMDSVDSVMERMTEDETQRGRTILQNFLARVGIRTA